MKSENRLLDFLIIAAALVPAAISLALDLIVPSDFYWFNRAGSLMVLFAVILEFRQEYFAQPTRSKGYMEQGVGLLIPTELSRFRKNLRWTAVTLAILGTVIWGYGDVPFRI